MLVKHDTRTRMPPRLKNKLEALGPTYFLIAWIMYEYMSLDPSVWAPWLLTLPGCYDCSILWSSEERLQLQGSAAYGVGGRHDVDVKVWNGIVMAPLTEPEDFPTEPWFSVQQRRWWLRDRVTWIATIGIPE